MVERLPPYAFLVAAGIAAGALWLVLSQITSLFVG